jgi:hypothetical protein
MTEDHSSGDMTNGPAPTGHRHEPRLIPLWVAGVAALAAMVVLLVVLIIARSVFNDNSLSAQKVEKEVVDQTGIATSTDDVDHPRARLPFHRKRTALGTRSPRWTRGFVRWRQHEP